ncbi:hypothetical protein [Aquabacterium humicola]|uniref:hypothetical protein n=1 Tax=Aquabacterium humicola TaxID=3237377 RepID=UPI0025433AC3|nr:hypothetical protein [Rubrivivax pictus]
MGALNTTKAWPAVLSPQHEFQRAAFRHWGTLIKNPQKLPGCRSGRTVWVSSKSPSMVLSWEWSEALPWIVVMANPMKVSTNVELLHAHGEAMDRDACVVVLNDVVNRLPWQRWVRRQLRGELQPFDMARREAVAA